MEYFMHVAIMVCIFAILGVSFNLLLGWSGLFACCSAIFWGVGAYTVALITIHLGFNFIPAMIIGMLVAAAISMIIAIPALRVHWDYFVIASIAFQYAMYNLMMNWTGITGGGEGLKKIPRADLFGYTFFSSESFLVLSIVFLIVVFLITRQLGRSPYGRVLRGIREDEIAVKSLGKNVTLIKVVTFAISAGLSAIAGSLYAHYVTFIIPYNFTLHETFLVVCIVVVGGRGNLWGSILGALVLVSLPELLRFVKISTSIQGVVQQLIYGSLLLILMVLRPQGLLPERLERLIPRKTNNSKSKSV